MSYINKVGCRLQSIYFQNRLFLNGILGLPAQTKEEIRLFKTIFDHFMGVREIKVFEWGSGFSTIFYAEYLTKKRAPFKWYSIDNNKVWHQKVTCKLRKKNLHRDVHLYLKEFPPFWEKPGWGDIPPPCGVFSPKSENEKAYINFPRILNDKLDIVIIDARFRKHCLGVAKEVVKPEGLVILHDAQKPHYHIGLEDFCYRKFFLGGAWYPFQKNLNKVWIGSMVNGLIFEKLSRL